MGKIGSAFGSEAMLNLAAQARPPANISQHRNELVPLGIKELIV